MASPTRTSVRFVPDSGGKRGIGAKCSHQFLTERWGVITIFQMVCSLATLLTVACTRTHTYEISGLVVYVSPKATPMFMMCYSFCAFYIDFLSVVAACVSTFDISVFQRSLMYIMATFSTMLFNLSSAIVIFVSYEDTFSNMALVALSSLTGLVFFVRSLWILLQILKLNRAS